MRRITVMLQSGYQHRAALWSSDAAGRNIHGDYAGEEITTTKGIVVFIDKDSHTCDRVAFRLEADGYHVRTTTYSSAPTGQD